MVIAGLLLAPLLLAWLLRSNPSLLFLSLCAGVVLQTFASREATELAAETNLVFLTSDLVNIALITLPMVLGLLLLRGTLDRSKLVMHILPAVCAGVLLMLATANYLPPSVRLELLSSQLWSELQKYSAAIIGLGVLASMLPLWLKQPRPHRDKKH